MNLSLYSEMDLFDPFFSFLKIVSCPTFSSMSFETIYKMKKKTYKNLHFQIEG